MPPSGKSIYKDTWLWNIGLSAYWFASQWKWFILLILVLPGQVEAVVPGGEENTSWGMIFALGGLWATVGPAFFGWLSDRVARRKPFIAVGAALTVCAVGILADGRSLLVIALGYFLLQLSDDIGQGAYSSLIPQTVPEEHRGKASSIMSAMHLLAQLAAAGSAMLIGDAAPFGLTTIQLVCVQVSVVNLAMAAWVLWTIRDFEEPFRGRSAPGFSWPVFIRPWRSRDFRWVWGTRVLVSVGFYLIQPFLKFYLEKAIAKPAPDGQLSYMLFRVDLGNTLTALMVAALSMAIFGAMAALIAVKLADTHGRKRLVRLGGVIMFAALLPFALLRDYTIIWVATCVFGAGYGLFMAADWALASDIVEASETKAQDMGIWQSSIALPQMLAFAAGALIDILNRQSSGAGYTYVFLGAAMFVLTGSLLVTKVEGSS